MSERTYNILFYYMLCLIDMLIILNPDVTIVLLRDIRIKDRVLFTNVSIA